MENEKIIVCNADEAEKKIQLLLDQSWKVKSMISENVSVSLSIASSSNDHGTEERKGKIIFILQKD